MVDFFRACQRQQLRVAADLAQFEQGVEDGDLRFGEAARVERIAYGFLHAETDGFVEVGLLAGQLDAHHGFDFRRHLDGNHRLGPPQHEGRDARAQLIHAFDIALFLDGRSEQRREAFLAAQKARHQEVEKAPDFAQMVFHRRARQTQTLSGL